MDIDKIKKALTKKNFRVYQVTDKEILVFFEDKNKVKFGSLRRDYYQRYGVSVSISLTKGSKNPWFSSNDYANSVDPKIVDILKSEKFKQLPELNFDLFKSIQD